MVDPAGPRAAQTADLWWFMLAAGLTIYALVMALLAAGLLVKPGGRGQMDDRARIPNVFVNPCL
ncbi:MAG: hypothetical protein LC797_02080 [Chloroflexi bacterium]|nr:hypothetical protein [Chloroflexota bacterium]